MMKFFFFLLSIAMTFAVLTGCDNPEFISGSSFIATVLENNESYLLVEPAEGSTELKSADRMTVSPNNATLLNAQNEEITTEDIEEGVQIEIFYKGGIAESYPAQVRDCYAIKLLD